MTIFLQGQTRNIIYSEDENLLGVKSNGQGDLIILCFEFKIIVKLFLAQYVTPPLVVSCVCHWLCGGKSVPHSSLSPSRYISICGFLLPTYL